MEDLSIYRDAFIEELEDQLERLERDLLELERHPSETLVQSIFRAAHTIKGSAAAMGFEEMKSLTHEIEHLLDQVRGGKLEVSTALGNVLFQALDVLKTLRDEYRQGGPFADTREILLQLRGFGGGPKADVAWRELPELTLEQSLLLEEAKESGLQLLKIQLCLADDCMMMAARFHLIAQEIESRIGSILVSQPSVAYDGQLEETQYAKSVFLVGSHHEAAEAGREAARYTDVAFAQVTAFQLCAATAVSKPAADAKEEAQSPGKGTAKEEKGKQGPQTIRVSVERLEHLMNLVGELLIDQTSLVQLKQSIAGRPHVEQFAERLSDITDHMSNIVGELQEGVMKSRMLPIEHLFNRFPRMVRDLSQKLGKEIELVLEGVETELDRTLIEEIGDPLIHLLRNAVDHGIEAAEIRQNRGKPAKGRVRMNACHEDNQVVVTIEDDGAGIDPERIKASAVRKGIVTEEEAKLLSEREAIYLIFQPGFSTASSVSEVSGRGVGMDIVRNQIERLNGVIDIRTEAGQGTRFTIRLPLTLAIITGLMVKVSGRTFVIPMNNVLEIVRIPLQDVQTIQGESVIVIREQVLPLLWLSDVLQYERRAGKGSYLPVVVIGSAEHKIALAVEELQGNQEVVIKSLGAYLGKLPYVSGATILGNGQVALILEMSYLKTAVRKQK